MKKYKIDLTAGSAEADIENIFEYIKSDSLQNAMRWYKSLKAKIQTLNAMPERCPKAPENELTHLTIYHLIVDNYRALYSIEDDTVQILHVRGSGQQNRL